MLHWQAPKWLSGISLETRVLFVSVLLHLVVLIALFVVYQGGANYNVTISSNMINPNSEIVFMPLHRSIKQPVDGGKSGKGASAKAAAKSSAPQVEKAIDVGGTTLVKIVQPKAKPKLSKKDIKKAEAKKALDAKNEKLKKEAQKKEQAAKKDTIGKAVAPVKDEKSESKVESKQVEQPAPDKTLEVKDNNNVNAASSDATVGSSDSNIVYVGQEEMDSLQAQEYIQQELAQHWAPPSGMRSDLTAIVTLTIDFEGVIKHVDLTTASGNMLFDTAAKKAASQITPARWAYGKKFAITFKP